LGLGMGGGKPLGSLKTTFLPGKGGGEKGPVCHERGGSLTWRVTEKEKPLAIKARGRVHPVLVSGPDERVMERLLGGTRKGTTIIQRKRKHHATEGKLVQHPVRLNCREIEDCTDNSGQKMLGEDTRMENKKKTLSFFKRVNS